MNSIDDFTNRIIKDDCFNIMPNIPDHSVDLILAEK